MRVELQRWHTLTLAAHTASMYETLLHPHNIVSESAKTYIFEDRDENELAPLRGLFAMKDVDGTKKKYFIEEAILSDLPVRVNAFEEVFYKENVRTKSIVHRPTDVTPFRIRPEKKWESVREFVDLIAPFQHTHPLEWTLNKIIALMGLIGKTFTCTCSPSEFGKSSIYLILDSITQASPVFQPRSVPGVLAQITGSGNMVFDEVHDAPSEVKSCMENFSLQVAGNSPIYINGALRSKNTKPKYDVAQQSITYLYNVITNYSSPDKQFWDNIWSNTKAMQSRFLPFKFDGKLLEEFDKDFNPVKVAEENKVFYVNMAKQISYLKLQKMQNLPGPGWKNNHCLNLKGRHRIIYEEILWLVDRYCTSQDEYDEMVKLMNKTITDYQTMLGNNSYTPVRRGVFDDYENNSQPAITEERIVDMPKDSEIVLEYIKANPGCYTGIIEEALPHIKDVEGIITKLSKTGEVFESQPACWKTL